MPPERTLGGRNSQPQSPESRPDLESSGIRKKAGVPGGQRAGEVRGCVWKKADSGGP